MLSYGNEHRMKITVFLCEARPNIFTLSTGYSDKCFTCPESSGGPPLAPCTALDKALSWCGLISEKTAAYWCQSVTELKPTFRQCKKCDLTPKTKELA